MSWINLNATDPAAPAGAQNVHFRTDAAHLGTESDPLPTTAFLAPFTGDAGAGGASGLVPAPAAGDALAGKVLRADGSWYQPPIMIGDAGAGGAAGLVPAPAAGDGSAGKFLKADGSWSAPSGGGGGGSIGLQTLTDGAVVVWDLSLGNGAITLGGSRNLANPGSMVAGQTYFLIVIQDATGSRSLSFGSAYKFPGGAPALSSGAGAIDVLTFVADGYSLYCVGMNLAQQVSIVPQFPGLVIWLKADAITGLTSGALVSSWPDSSGNGHAATQTTASRQPVYATAVQNGLPVVQFADTNTVGLVTSLNFSGIFELFVLYRRTATPGGNHRAVQGNNNWLIGPYAANHSLYDNGFIYGPAVVQNQWVRACVTCDGSTESLYMNGNLIGSNGSSAGPGPIILGAPGGYNEPLGGEIAELIGYSAQLTALQRASVFGYLSSKWAL